MAQLPRQIRVPSDVTAEERLLWLCANGGSVAVFEALENAGFPYTLAEGDFTSERRRMQWRYITAAVARYALPVTPTRLLDALAADYTVGAAYAALLTYQYQLEEPPRPSEALALIGRIRDAADRVDLAHVALTALHNLLDPEQPAWVAAYALAAVRKWPSAPREHLGVVLPPTVA